MASEQDAHSSVERPSLTLSSTNTAITITAEQEVSGAPDIRTEDDTNSKPEMPSSSNEHNQNIADIQRSADLVHSAVSIEGSMVSDQDASVPVKRPIKPSELSLSTSNSTITGEAVIDSPDAQSVCKPVGKIESDVSLGQVDVENVMQAIVQDCKSVSECVSEYIDVNLVDAQPEINVTAVSAASDSLAAIAAANDDELESANSDEPPVTSSVESAANESEHHDHHQTCEPVDQQHSLELESPTSPSPESHEWFNTQGVRFMPQDVAAEDPEEDRWRSQSASVNNDRASISSDDESEKDCKSLTFGLNTSSPSQDVPPEFEKVFVKVEDVHASDEEPVEQKFWIEEPCVGQEPQAGYSSRSDEVDHQHGRDLDSTTVNGKGGSHQHKDLTDDPPVTNYPEVPESKTFTLNNTLTIDKVYACGFEQKEYLSIPIEVSDKETKTSTMDQVDEEMLVATSSQQSRTQNSSKNRLTIKNYVCEICDFGTVTLTILKGHMMREHSDKKRFHCKFCEYKCSKISHLKVHERTHTGEKPFSCKSCDYKCSKSSALKVHERTHTGEKPFNCEFCDYKCSTSSALRVHERKHTG